MNDSSTEKQNSVSEEEQKLLMVEEQILAEVLNSLESQAKHKDKRLYAEGLRSRELTSELVAASRDEDKAMLASDEAVSHALRLQHSKDAKGLARLLAKPYFARFVLEEERDGDIIELEYRLGFVANPDCRIIDWRKSPLAKIFYEYREGDEYAEEVQGTEREGVIALRHTLVLQDGVLQEVNSSKGSFIRDADGEWCKKTHLAPPRGGIKDVLPLITSEQFAAITEQANTAVLIQGVAGSGKTTVALHRLAWLLHENNSDLKAEECAIVVRSEILAQYIKLTLDALHIEEVPVYTFEQWAGKLLKRYCGKPVAISHDHASEFPVPRGLLMLRYAEDYFTVFEEKLKTASFASPEPEFWGFLKEVLLTASSTKPDLLNRLGIDVQSVLNYYTNLERHSEEQGSVTIPPEDLLSLVRYTQTRSKKRGAQLSPPLRFRHLVVDELQDFSLMGLASIIESVDHTKHLTLVGDVAQALNSDHDFVGWERLKAAWQIEQGEAARFFTLEVSHRSSLPIMRLASSVARQPAPTEGRAGRTPIWFHRADEQDALASAIGWLNTATERYSNLLTAVLCMNNEEASYIYKLLAPTFGPTVRHGKRSDFSFDEGIVVATISDVKGLEFANVLLWNPSKEHYPAGSRLAQNRLYVAMTRAEENLCLVSSGRYSPLLPSTRSKLVRGHDYRDEYIESKDDDTTSRWGTS